MKTLSVALVILLAGACLAADQAPPEIVLVPSGKLVLKGFLWRPVGPSPFPAVLFVHGSGTDALHTGGFEMKEAAEKLAPVFVKHGYVFLYLCRRGQGLSVGQGVFMQDLLQREQASGGTNARERLQYTLMTTDQLDDVLAGISFLKALAGVDAHRIAIVGHSFGGQLALLAAERDQQLRAAITFAAAANSWARSSEIRDRLLLAAREIKAPLMLLHAENDYSTAPGKALAEELKLLGKPHSLKIYPPVGQTSEDGHNFVYTQIPLWETDVFGFLDQHIKH